MILLPYERTNYRKEVEDCAESKKVFRLSSLCLKLGQADRNGNLYY